jgi:flagellar FliJ protein
MISHHESDGAIPRDPAHTFVRPALINGPLVRRARRRLITQKRFQIDTARRQVDQIEAMIADLNRMASALDREIFAEESRTGIRNPAHFAYSTYARAAIARRDNLKRSADKLRDELNDAKAAFAEALNGAEEAADLPAVLVPETELTTTSVLSATGQTDAMKSLAPRPGLSVDDRTSRSGACYLP